VRSVRSGCLSHSTLKNWTLTVRNYCSSFLSPMVLGGGLIHAVSGNPGGEGTPLTNRLRTRFWCRRSFLLKQHVGLGPFGHDQRVGWRYEPPNFLASFKGRDLIHEDTPGDVEFAVSVKRDKVVSAVYGGSCASALHELELQHLPPWRTSR
jgi:hypothetical protein